VGVGLSAAGRGARRPSTPEAAPKPEPEQPAAATHR
jgi:hypothetical protein